MLALAGTALAAAGAAVVVMVVMLVAMVVEVVVVMGMVMVVGVAVGMGMGVGHAVMGMLVGMVMGVLMMVGTAGNMVVMDVHGNVLLGNFSFIILEEGNSVKVYFVNKVPHFSFWVPAKQKYPPLGLA